MKLSGGCSCEVVCVCVCERMRVRACACTRVRMCEAPLKLNGVWRGCQRMKRSTTSNKKVQRGGVAKGERGYPEVDSFPLWFYGVCFRV